MPGMSPEQLKDAGERLGKYLSERPGYELLSYIDSGGSASIYKVGTPHGVRVVKVYDCRFFEGTSADAERRRLKLQLDLVGHPCPTLVQIYEVTEAHGTAFIEMEFVPWPSLKAKLSEVPDDSIPSLLSQLVEAVIYLERREIVHRDIKPENIHVSDDFQQLKLIDLGVARELSRAGEDGPDSTDHGNLRPFIATAQYSSPEYLFRLDEPSPSLWKGLSLYQIGAVLHDFLAKRPLFEAEVSMGNRWLVARAVLSKTPTFPDGDPGRLPHLKALALRCLTKDSSTRLRIVDWSDFDAASTSEPLASLAARLSRGGAAANAHALAATEARLCFDRSQLVRLLCNNCKQELIHACGNRIPIVMQMLAGDPPEGCELELRISDDVRIQARIRFDWLGTPNQSSAQINVRACIANDTSGLDTSCDHLVTACTLDGDADVYSKEAAGLIAQMIAKTLDILEAGTPHPSLQGTDIATLTFQSN